MKLFWEAAERATTEAERRRERDILSVFHCPHWMYLCRILTWDKTAYDRYGIRSFRMELHCAKVTCDTLAGIVSARGGQQERDIIG